MGLWSSPELLSPNRARIRQVYHFPGWYPDKVAYARGTSATLERLVFVCSERRSKIHPTLGGRSYLSPLFGGVHCTSIHCKSNNSLARSHPSHKKRLARPALAQYIRAARVPALRYCSSKKTSKDLTWRSSRAQLGLALSPTRSFMPLAVPLFLISPAPTLRGEAPDCFVPAGCTAKVSYSAVGHVGSPHIRGGSCAIVQFHPGHSNGWVVRGAEDLGLMKDGQPRMLSHKLHDRVQ
eukprot:scaffold7155_cov119-Amphora_coffeaeformis.AAC.3